MDISLDCLARWKPPQCARFWGWKIKMEAVESWPSFCLCKALLGDLERWWHSMDASPTHRSCLALALAHPVRSRRGQDMRPTSGSLQGAMAAPRMP